MCHEAVTDMLHHKECTDLESHFGSGFLDFGFWTLHLCLQQPAKLQFLSVKRQQRFFLVVLPVIFIAHSKELLSLTSINCKTSLVLLCRLAGLPPKTSLDSSMNLSVVLETARGKTIQKCICGFLAGEMQPLVKLVTA